MSTLTGVCMAATESGASESAAAADEARGCWSSVANVIAQFEPVTVAWFVFFIHRFISKVVHSVFREYFKEKLCSKNAGIQMSFVGFNICFQRTDNFFVLISRNSHF